jgi:hypothetical protein
MGPREPTSCERWLLRSRNTDVGDQHHRRWAAGCPVLLGLILPSAISLVSLAALTGGIWDVVSLQNGAGPGIFLIVFAAFISWLVFKMLRTVWLVTSADTYLVCVSMTASWTIPFDDLVSVTRDAYGFFIIITTRQRRLFLWSHIDRHEGLVSLIASANPGVQFGKLK